MASRKWVENKVIISAIPLSCMLYRVAFVADIVVAS